MDGAEADKRERERIERLYGFGPPTPAEVAESERAPQLPANANPGVLLPPPSGPTPVAITHKLVIGDIDLNWYVVFSLAFRFTVALAVLNIPLGVALYLILTR